jgi:hypothetical protein
MYNENNYIVRKYRVFELLLIMILQIFVTLINRYYIPVGNILILIVNTVYYTREDKMLLAWAKYYKCKLIINSKFTLCDK